MTQIPIKQAKEQKRKRQKNSRKLGGKSKKKLLKMLNVRNQRFATTTYANVQFKKGLRVLKLRQDEEEYEMMQQRHHQFKQ